MKLTITKFETLLIVMIVFMTGMILTQVPIRSEVKSEGDLVDVQINNNGTAMLTLNSTKGMIETIYRGSVKGVMLHIPTRIVGVYNCYGREIREHLDQYY